MQKSFAFTLIELLVVITIIVVLLALLTPALDKAIYQAQLAVCGAEKKAMVSGTTTYAAVSRRHFPTMGGAWDIRLPSLIKIKGPDMRPLIKDYMDIDKAFNDPLIRDVAFEVPKYPNTSRLRSANHYYPDWRPMGTVRGTGMKKMGDRMAWIEPGPEVKRRSGVMGADKLCLRGDGRGYATHPESKAVWIETWAEGDETYPPRSADSQAFHEAYYSTDTVAEPNTLLYWQGLNALRGTVDLNFGYVDGAVVRLGGVEIADERLAFHSHSQAGNFVPIH